MTAVDPSKGFLAAAASRLGPRATTKQGTAAELPLDDASADVTMSGLVLNFTPDPLAALVEQSRVTVPGGTVAAYVWDYADGMEFMRLFWDAALEVDVGRGPPDEVAEIVSTALPTKDARVPLGKESAHLALHRRRDDRSAAECLTARNRPVQNGHHLVWKADGDLSAHAVTTPA